MTVEQLVLDDEMQIDQKATASKVRSFLGKSFERYLNFAGLNRADLSVLDDTHLSSPKMDVTGVSAKGGVNHTEASFLRVYESKQACMGIHNSIKKCQDGSRKMYRTILTEVYLKEVDDWKVQAQLGYSARQYATLKRRALCEFADRFEAWCIDNGIDYLPKLHVWKK